MAHVTVPDLPIEESFAVGGTPTDTFNYSFSTFEADGSDVQVFNDGVDPDTPLVGGYTITPTAGTDGGFEGGQIVLDTPVTSTTIRVKRDSTIERTTDFPLVGPFLVEELNTQLDKIIAYFQELKTENSSNLTLIQSNETVATDHEARITAIEAQLASIAAGKFDGFSSETFEIIGPYSSVIETSKKNRLVMLETTPGPVSILLPALNNLSVGDCYIFTVRGGSTVDVRDFLENLILLMNSGDTAIFVVHFSSAELGKTWKILSEF